MKFLESWESRLARLSEHSFHLALLLGVALLCALSAICLSLFLNHNFLLIACDTALIQNGIVNTLHGAWFRNTVYDGPNILGEHTTLVLLLVAPIYAFFPSADTLFILQVLGVASLVVPLYLIACDVTGRPLTALLVALVGLTCPIALHMALAPFHPETWISPAILWAYYFYRRNRPTAFWIAAAFAVSCGEQASLILIALGLSLWFCEDGLPWRPRYASFSLLGGLAWLLLSVGVIIPLVRAPDQHNLFAYNYSDWSVHTSGSDYHVRSAAELAYALAQDPLQALLQLIGPARWFHLLFLTGIPLLLAFTARRTLLLLVPVPVYFFMSHQEFFLYFHAYYFQFAFFAGCLALLAFVTRWEVTTRLGLSVLVLSLLFNFLGLSFALGTYTSMIVGALPTLSAQLRDVFHHIPASAGVYSPHRYTVYLSNRPNLVMGDLIQPDLDFDSLIQSHYSTTGVRPDQIDYIVCDLDNDQCGSKNAGYDTETAKLRSANLTRLVKTGQWAPFLNNSDVVILRRVKK